MNRRRALVLMTNIGNLIDMTINYENDYIMTEDEFKNVILRDYEYHRLEDDYKYFDSYDVNKIREMYFFLEEEDEITKMLIEHYILCVIDFDQNNDYQMKMSRLRTRLLTELSKNIEVAKGA